MHEQPTKTHLHVKLTWTLKVILIIIKMSSTSNELYSPSDGEYIKPNYIKIDDILMCGSLAYIQKANRRAI